jgi:hypothetical protein
MRTTSKLFRLVYSFDKMCAQSILLPHGETRLKQFGNRPPYYNDSFTLQLLELGHEEQGIA